MARTTPSSSSQAYAVAVGTATDHGAPTELPRLAAGSEGRLVPGDGLSTTIQFVNHGTRRVDVFWLDPQGRRRRYTTLAPGDGFEAMTFVNHPWMIAADDGTGPFVVIAADRPGLVTIT